MFTEEGKQKTDIHRDLIWSYVTVRQILGLLGIALPIIVIGRHLIATNFCQVLPTISHYYYTVAGDVFVGTLCAYGVFLFMYVGYDNKENCLANVAAVAAIMIALFPTNPTKEQTVMCSHAIWAWSNLVHNISVGLFFGILGYFSLCKFTLTNEKQERTLQKQQRDKIYRVCGVVMLCCVAILLVATVSYETPLTWIGDAVFETPVAMLLEIFCLWSFGISWLTKGEMICKDLKNTNTP